MRRHKPVNEYREAIYTGNRWSPYGMVTVTYRNSMYLAGTRQDFDNRLRRGEIRTEHEKQTPGEDYRFGVVCVLNTDDYIDLARRFGCWECALDALRSKIHHKIDTGEYGKPKADIYLNGQKVGVMIRPAELTIHDNFAGKILSY